jgi:hypothetical protein
LIHDSKDTFRAGFKSIPTKEILIPEITKYQGFLKDNMAMADMLLTELYSNFAAMSENIQGQAYWDNNKRISNDLFQIHFNMSISIAKEVTFFDTLDQHIQEIHETYEKKSNGNRGRAAKKTIYHEVDNENTKAFTGKVKDVAAKITGLKQKVQLLQDAINDIWGKAPHLS